MKLRQILLDVRTLSTEARASIVAPDGVDMLQITNPLAAPLTAGNVMMLCVDPHPLGVITLLGWVVTAHQMLHELKHGTLLINCAQVQKASPWSYLLISGSIQPAPDGKKIELNGRSSSFEWRAIQGALLTIAEMGVQVVWIGEDKRLGDTLVWLAERDRSPKKVQPARETLFATPAEQILTALPGIGPERADQLLRNTGGNVILALNALTDPENDMPGIPQKVREDARKIFALPDDCAVGVVAPITHISF